MYILSRNVCCCCFMYSFWGGLLASSCKYAIRAATNTPLAGEVTAYVFILLTGALLCIFIKANVHNPFFAIFIIVKISAHA